MPFLANLKQRQVRSEQQEYSHNRGNKTIQTVIQANQNNSSDDYYRCRLVSADANIALDGSLLTLDTKTIANDDKILVTAQTDPKTNGLYKANLSGAWLRFGDIKAGNFFTVFDGSKYINTEWMLTSPTVDIGSTDIIITRPTLSSKAKEFPQFFAQKVTIVDNDVLLIEDSENSYIKKAVSYVDMKNVIILAVTGEMDYRIKHYSNDIPGYGNEKFEPGDAISFEWNVVAGFYALKIHSSDKRVGITALDIFDSGKGDYLDNKITTSVGVGKEVRTDLLSCVQTLDIHLYDFESLVGITLTSLTNPTFAVQDDPLLPEDIKKMNWKNLWWFQKSADCLITQDGVTGDYTIKIPNTNKFPYDGYYSFFAHIAMLVQWQWDSDTGLPDPRERYGDIRVDLLDSDGVQVLEMTPYHINTLGEKLVCPDICCCKIEGQHVHYWINVQGFAHISSPADCRNRYFRVRVNKPTSLVPDIFSVSACNWEAVYYGETLGSWCQ